MSEKKGEIVTMLFWKCFVYKRLGN